MDRTMTFKTQFRSFLSRDDGAMTTDFVVLTGGILIAGMIVVVSLLPMLTGFADNSTRIEPNNAMIQRFTTPK